MGYTLSEFAADIRRELTRDRSAATIEAVCRLVSRALTDQEFVTTHLKDRPAGANPREILYEEPQLGKISITSAVPTSRHASPSRDPESCLLGAWPRRESDKRAPGRRRRFQPSLSSRHLAAFYAVGVGQQLRDMDLV